MLTYEDCSDYCDLSDHEVQGLINATNMTPIEVCAMVQQFADSPTECRKMVKFLMEYLEKMEAKGDANESHEIHTAIDHFVSNHHMV